MRKRAWDSLSKDSDLDTLDKLTQVISLDDVLEASQQIVAGKVRGRIVIDMNL
jgi:acrylyl-CoA reductase (NADPH)